MHHLLNGKLPIDRRRTRKHTRNLDWSLVECSPRQQRSCHHCARSIKKERILSVRSFLSWYRWRA